MCMSSSVFRVVHINYGKSCCGVACEFYFPKQRRFKVFLQFAFILQISALVHLYFPLFLSSLSLLVYAPFECVCDLYSPMHFNLCLLLLECFQTIFIHLFIKQHTFCFMHFNWQFCFMCLFLSFADWSSCMKHHESNLERIYSGSNCMADKMW